jgi:6-phosphogluconolactonase
MSDLQRFESPRELAESLASFICASLTRAIAEKGNAHLVVSGGNTPIPLFHRLSNVDIP